MNLRKAFTLIELLVVIAIIAILAAILFPVFAQAKAAAKKTVSLSNMKQEELSLIMYANDNNDTFICEWPYYNNWNNPITDLNHTFHPYLNPYIKSKALWAAPGSAALVSSPIYQTTNGINYNDEQDSALTGGYSMSYLMNETGWSDGVNYDHLNQFNNAGLSDTVYPDPADEIQLFESEGSNYWIGVGQGGYQVGLSWNGGNSTIPQPSNPNQGFPIAPVINSSGTVVTPGLYNVPGADWGLAGIPDTFVNFRYGTPGINASFFDGHVKFQTSVILKQVQPYYYDPNNTATNWTN